MIVELEQAQKAEPLFDGWQETMVWSCLQGVMGKMYADSLESPASAMILLGDFCFLAGKPDKDFFAEKNWAWFGKGRQDFMIMVPKDEGWAALIEKYLAGKADKVTRYAIKKEPDIFHRGMLQAAIERLPEGYVLQMIDEALFWRCKEIEWCGDWVAQYEDYAEYQKYGLGAVIMKEGEPVSGASSYSSYAGGIEIEVDTREDCRRKGLAYICAAKLILECLERGWYPSWDAQNKESVALAEKLGYHFDYEYVAYEVYLRRG